MIKTPKTNLQDKLKKMPVTPGIYLMRDASGKIIYIGKAINLKRRVISYFRSDAKDKAAIIAGAVRHLDYILLASEREALILERDLINKYQPYYNAMWRDDKSYPYLKLTVKEDFPRLFLSRKLINDGSEYFGPYPQVNYIKHLMKWLQKLFKWRPCRIVFNEKELPNINKVKSCIYFHTELCPGPCMGKISSAAYKEGMRELALFLRNKYKKLENIWTQQMKQASSEMQYEKAADLRDRLNALSLMHEKVTIREIKKEDLADSIKITQTLEELKEKLKLQKWPVIIEGFDISIISGSFPVGSMVRFLNAKPDKDNYRKYKIKTVSGMDDFSMIREVVFRRYRRLKIEGSVMPDLILIDGGKGQLSSAKSSLDSLKLNIPIISLAKKEEEIFFPDLSDSLKLSPDSPALHLLQSIRDESHRFALAFHHLRRKNSIGLNNK